MQTDQKIYIVQLNLGDDSVHDWTNCGAHFNEVTAQAQIDQMKDEYGIADAEFRIDVIYLYIN